jgi:hypothetical protein
MATIDDVDTFLLSTVLRRARLITLALDDGDVGAAHRFATSIVHELVFGFPDETADTEPLDALELVRRLALILLAFDEQDPATAARFTAELHAELLNALLSSASPRGEGNHQGGALVGREGCLNGSEDLAAAVHGSRYDGFEETMRGPPMFTLIVAGELEGQMRVAFHHTPCNDGERDRLVEWLSRTPMLGPLLSKALDRI